MSSYSNSLPKPMSTESKTSEFQEVVTEVPLQIGPGEIVVVPTSVEAPDAVVAEKIFKWKCEPEPLEDGVDVDIYGRELITTSSLSLQVTNNGIDNVIIPEGTLLAHVSFVSTVEAVESDNRVTPEQRSMVIQWIYQKIKEDEITSLLGGESWTDVKGRLESQGFLVSDIGKTWTLEYDEDSRTVVGIPVETTEDEDDGVYFPPPEH